jgi:Leucine-rich repeat (LRR) protein
MKKLFVVSLTLLLSNALFSQEPGLRIFSWEEAKGASPDTVYAISFSKQKLTTLPDDLARFANLKHLDLGKNKLDALPDFVGTFSKLDYLDLSKNELSVFPVEICRLSSLKVLVINRNTFDQIPECIGYLKDLEELDLWDTPVMNFPTSLTNLKNLKRIDLQGVKYGPTFQKQFRESLPWVKIEFDPPCDCME